MTRKILLGMVAWLPLLAVVGLAVYLALGVIELGLGVAPSVPDLNDPRVLELLYVLVGGAVAIAFWQLGFCACFITDASKRRGLTGLPLALWTLGFVFFGELVFAIYWLIYVVRDRRPPAQAMPAA